MKTFSVKIPSGIRDGEKVRLLGQGKQGQNGGKNGDMFIKINIQNNDKFRLQGYDIVTDLYLTPWEAALGKRVNIDSIEDPISTSAPPEHFFSSEFLSLRLSVHPVPVHVSAVVLFLLPTASWLP